MKKFRKINNKFIKKALAEKGQAAFEFVLMLPFLLLIFFTVCQLGFMIYIQNNLTQISREAARIISTTNSSKEAFNLADSCSLLKNYNHSIEVVPSDDSSRQTGDIVTVKISIKYRGFANIISHFIGEDLEINAKTAMRMECQ